MIRRREFDATLIIRLELFEVSKHKLPEAAKNLLGYLVSRPHKRNRLDAIRSEVFHRVVFWCFGLEEPTAVFSCKREGWGCERL